MSKRHRGGGGGLVRYSSSTESSTPPSSSIAAAGIQSSSSWFPPQSSDMSDFSEEDYMLVEVLCRLPSTLSVVQCRRVCKTWYRIIWVNYILTP
ncbi:hypothetical protein Tsubulata_015608 [Turnera subulata]|uniref:F-box domain-containing protein n=1 Tax=Turnera subulata TaxID=218843 RepID=A0A9Q0FFV9_9ROSI|nr:hypothetical protein Tsubulata_015608 [Turnera subulata]